MNDRLYSRVVLGSGHGQNSDEFENISGTVYSRPWSMRDAWLMSIEISTRDGTGALVAVATLQRSLYKYCVEDPTNALCNWVDVPVAEAQLFNPAGAESNDITELSYASARGYRVKLVESTEGGARVIVHSRG